MTKPFLAMLCVAVIFGVALGGAFVGGIVLGKSQSGEAVQGAGMQPGGQPGRQGIGIQAPGIKADRDRRKAHAAGPALMPRVSVRPHPATRELTGRESRHSLNLQNNRWEAGTSPNRRSPGIKTALSRDRMAGEPPGAAALAAR